MKGRLARSLGSETRPFLPHKGHFFPLLNLGINPRLLNYPSQSGNRRRCPLVSAYSQVHMADCSQGGAEATLQDPVVFPVPIHHALQSTVSGWPVSLLWLCSSSAPGLDSTKSPFGRQASPNMRPFGVPSLRVPIWHPATPGLTPSLSFHHVVWPSFQSAGLNSNVP